MAMSRPRSSSTSASARSSPAVTPAAVRSAAVADMDRVLVDVNGGIAQRQLLGDRPMGGDAPPVEQSRRGQAECAAAHRAEAPRCRRVPSQPVDHSAVGRDVRRVRASGDQQRVDRLQIRVDADDVIGHQPHPRRTADRARLGRDHDSADRRGSPACTLASANTSSGPETSSNCTPGIATIAIVLAFIIAPRPFARLLAEIDVLRRLQTT